MIFEQIDNGGDRNFGYLIGDAKAGVAAVVDPSYIPQTYLDRIATLQLNLKYVICTHSHQDHINGNDYVQEHSDAEVIMCQDADYFYDIAVADNQVIELGTLRLKIFHTPGHSDDCICILVENKLVTGDTLFVGKVGGTDLDDGARRQFESLQKLMTLDASVEVYPGHNYGARPWSTIGDEKTTNPFLLQPDFDAFVNLKKNWTAYKKLHNIV